MVVLKNDAAAMAIAPDYVSLVTKDRVRRLPLLSVIYVLSFAQGIEFIIPRSSVPGALSAFSSNLVCYPVEDFHLTLCAVTRRSSMHKSLDVAVQQ